MIRRRHPGCVSSCGGTACPARTSAPWRRRYQDRPTRCVAIAVQPSAVGNLGPGASEHCRDCRKDSSPTRLAVPGREGPAPAPFRRRMTGTPPGGSRTRVACSAPVSPSLPTCAPVSMLSTPAPSTQVRYEITRKSHRKPIPAPHEIRPGWPRPSTGTSLHRCRLIVDTAGRRPRCRPCASRVQIWLICVPPRA
jgi:hypothetical protein